MTLWDAFYAGILAGIALSTLLVMFSAYMDDKLRRRIGKVDGR